MDRIKLLSNEEASSSAKEVLDKITSGGGRVINIFKVMANSAAALKSFFGFKKALDEKTLGDDIEERIAIRLAVLNGCEYCLAAHSYSASKVLSQDEILLAREAKSSDSKAQAALEFADSVMKTAGRVSDDEFNKIKSVGFTDAEILEIVAVVSLNFYTNAINSVAHTKVDFPKPKE